MKNTSLLEHLGYVAMIKICGGEKAIQEKYENKIVNTYKELEEISFDGFLAVFVFYFCFSQKGFCKDCPGAVS